MVKRLLDFYHRYSNVEPADISIIWRDLIRQSQKPLIDALAAKDEGMLQDVLERFSPLGCAVGLGGPQTLPWDSNQAMTTMESLAHKVGILPIQNPSQDSPSKAWKLTSVSEAKAQVEKILKLDMSLPDHAGLKCSWPNGGIPYAFPFYCSAAMTMLSLFDGNRPDDILEIGAGLGNFGFIGWQWKIHSYTVIDLPSMAVLSAYNVSKCCGPENVWLKGEPPANKFASFYPSTDYVGVEKNWYDLVFNSDSFPEIPDAIQDKYLNLIASCMGDGFFLSINHESDRAGQRRVYEAVKANGNLRLLSRNAFMMRDGYIEEVYVRI